MTGTKICRYCEVEKDLDSFSRHPNTKDKRNPRCKACKNEQQRQFYQENREQLLPRFKAYRRLNWRRSQYGISNDEFAAMVAAQNGECLFGHAVPETEKLVVDHSHSTGKVRGILCSSCNLAIGHFREDISRLEAAIAYLKLHNSTEDCQSGNGTAC